MKNQEELRNSIISALSQCLKLTLGAACSKVIAINRSTLEVILTDESDKLFSSVDDIYEHPVYDVTYVTALLIYSHESDSFAIDDDEVDLLVEDFFPEEFSFDIDLCDDCGAEEDTGEFSREEIDYWYLNRADDD